MYCEAVSSTIENVYNYSCSGSLIDSINVAFPLFIFAIFLAVVLIMFKK